MIQLPKFRFSLSEEIYWKWRQDEALFCIIEGELGAGKSSVTIQMLRELYQGEEWKKYLVFKPEDFLNLVDSLIMQEPPKKVPLIAWDDAGLWLYAMDWADERVKSVVKFLNVMRTVVGGLIFTTPTQEMLVGKIPVMPGVRIASVTRTSGHSRDTRHFIVARQIKARWGKKWVKDYIEDDFNVMLPTEVYSYYKPLRDQYAREANVLMREAWHARLKSSRIAKEDNGAQNEPR